MTDQQIFLAHKEQIQKKIVTENNRRVTLQGVPELTPEETEVVVSEIISILRNGGRVAEYKFTEPKTNQTVKKTGSVSQKQNFNGELINFDVVMCSNGFVLNMNKDGIIKPYIFKSEKELMEIFKETLFGRLKKMKERRKEDELARNNNTESAPSGKEREGSDPTQGVISGIGGSSEKVGGDIEECSIPDIKNNAKGYGCQSESTDKTGERLNAEQDEHSGIQTADESEGAAETSTHSRENEQVRGRVLLKPSESA